MIGRGTAWTLIGALMTALCGCASEDSAGRFLVTPGKYVLYNCAQLSDAAQANYLRQQELEKLMAKAGNGSGAAIVSGLSYRPEHVQLHGEMNELSKANVERNCKPFNLSNPTGRYSDQAVR